MFTLPKSALKAKLEEYKCKVPDTLGMQFPERLTKKDAIKKKESRKRLRTPLVPIGKVGLLH